ncbi:MAG: hypothetical protein R3184_06590 [Aurantimonas coralicida]|nr:hypothetical protein [Aurantimonas coralicida]
MQHWDAFGIDTDLPLDVLSKLDELDRVIADRDLGTDRDYPGAD